MIPLFKVNMPPGLLEPLGEVLYSGYIGQGPKVKQFEEELVPWLGTKNVLTLNCGTSAIHLALRLAGVGHGDEVISTPMTCTATNEPIMERGADIVWADIDPTTGNIDPNDVERKVTSRTKAIVCVHWAGYPCDMDELNEIGQRRGIPVIQDAAHAFDAKYKRKGVGACSQFACFSFQAIKHITTVDGGALTCTEDRDYRRGKLLRWYGIDREARGCFRCEDDIPEHGYKFHMNDVCAMVGLAQLEHAKGIMDTYRRNAWCYNDRLSGLRRVRLPGYKTDREASYWIYSLLVDNIADFTRHMEQAGVQVSPVHKRNDIHSMMAPYNRGPLPGVDEFAGHQVSIPVGWWLTNDDLETIIVAVKAYDGSK